MKLGIDMYSGKILLILFIFSLIPVAGAHGKMVNGPHDLSLLSMGTDQKCIFCHISHHANDRGNSGKEKLPLWNRVDPEKHGGANYKYYTSSTINFSPGKPTKNSKLCLSCHDGTVALGKTYRRHKFNKPDFSMTIYKITPNMDSYIGENLTDDHPISFQYSEASRANSQIKRIPGPNVVLDPDGDMQCTSCHESHSSPYPNLLLASNYRSALCKECHAVDGWEDSSHSLSNAKPLTSHDPWPKSDYQTVAENGCDGCHYTHRAGKPERLLSSSIEEDVCFNCHDGSVSKKNIEQIMKNKKYIHPVNRSNNRHDAAEVFPLTNTKLSDHVECGDCHNPHQVKPRRNESAPAVSGLNRGVSGINLNGRFIETSQNTYEICFKCHSGDSKVYTSRSRRIVRQNDEFDLLKEFDTSNQSYHPVVNSGANSFVPSLKDGWTTSSMMYCHDCHNNDKPEQPSGPHGSDYEFMLERNYDASNRVVESEYAFALCYKCHDREYFRPFGSKTEQSGFPEHAKHMEKYISCAACHDPHGVQPKLPGHGDSTHLINFAQGIVSRSNAGGEVRWEDMGYGKGRCFLKCHGVDHAPLEYGGN